MIVEDIEIDPQFSKQSTSWDVFRYFCPCGAGMWPWEPRLTGSVPPLQYQVEPAQLVTRRLQVSVWHLGTLARRVFLGEVIIPLASWDFADSTTQSFCWYTLRAKVMSGLGLNDLTPTVRIFQRDPRKGYLPGKPWTQDNCGHLPGCDC